MYLDNFVIGKYLYHLEAVVCKWRHYKNYCVIVGINYFLIIIKSLFPAKQISLPIKSGLVIFKYVGHSNHIFYINVCVLKLNDLLKACLQIHCQIFFQKRHIKSLVERVMDYMFFKNNSLDFIAFTRSLTSCSRWAEHLWK